MTTIETDSAVQVRPAEATAGKRKLRAAVWALHVFISAVGIFSLVTDRFSIWVDLRKLGWAALPVECVWVASVLLLRICAIPALHGAMGKRVWANGGISPTWGRRLLWPTYFLLACLAANGVYYYRLRMLGEVDPMVPMPLVAFGVIGLWALLAREWMRRRERLPATSPIGGNGILLGGMYAVGCVALVAGTFFIFSFQAPPKGAVDLAVVLGGAVSSDGTASIHLADRTRVAIELYKRGMAGRILLSGYHHPPARVGGPVLDEVAAMEKVCLDAGVPESALYLDPVGINTRATAFNAREFMHERGYSTVVACSTDYHLYRTALSFREMGIEAATLPAQPVWRCATMYDLFRELSAVMVYRIDPNYREPKAMAMHVTDARVVVKKSANVLELYDGGRLVKTYRCITGGNGGDKAVEGDRKTPEGTFRVVFKNPQSKFHLSLGLDYPNEEDAKRGVAEKLITQQQYADILAALKSDLTVEANQKKLWYTPLGGEIFIHGHANDRTGTAGCVAMDDLDIEELYAVLPLKTVVEIRP